MNKISLLGVSLLCVAACANNASEQEHESCKAHEFIAAIEDIPTIQAFTSEAVPEAVVTKLLNAAVNTSSAMNMQPWHFTAVSGEDNIAKVAEGAKMPFGNPPAGMPAGVPPMPKDGESMPPMPTRTGPHAGVGDSPLLIIVAYKKGQEYNAGLATQSICAEATVLGYGTKIVMGGASGVNSNKATYGIPDDMDSVAIVLVGKTETEGYDAVSGASARKDFSEVVTVIK